MSDLARPHLYSGRRSVRLGDWLSAIGATGAGDERDVTFSRVSP